jgi:hypothetical protein
MDGRGFGFFRRQKFIQGPIDGFGAGSQKIL